MHAKEIQMKASRFLGGEKEVLWTDLGEWKSSQIQIMEGVEQLLWLQGDTPELEAERILAILMGYAVTVQHKGSIEQTLQRAEEIIPLVSEPVLKCHLLVFCYGVCYDDELCREAELLIAEIKRKGRGEEICMVEELLEGMKDNGGITF